MIDAQSQSAIHLDSTPLKLHLGCGADYLQGWVNIDRDSSAKTDMQLSFLELDTVFQKSTVGEAMMIHSLNYLRLWEARKVFRTLHSLFVPGGKLIIETADLEACVRKLQENIGNFEQYIEGVRALHGFGMDHLAAEAAFTPNAFSWTRWHLEAELRDAGFTNIQFSPPKTHAPWRDMRVEAIKPAVVQTASYQGGNGAQKTTVLSAVFSPSEQSKKFPPGRILILMDPDKGHATVSVRGLIHKEKFKEHGWHAEFLDIRGVAEEEIAALAKSFDIVYLLKVASLRLMNLIKQHSSAKIVFDLTDALWRPPHFSLGWADINRILISADYVFSENEYVCEYGRRFNRVWSIPVVTHSEEFAALRKQIPPRSDGRFRIGWMGSTGTFSAILNIRDVIQEISSRYPMVEFRFIGCDDPAQIQQLGNTRFSVLPSYDHRTMLEEILHLDVGLFPPPINEEDYCIRGALKAMLYMQGGATPVCLDAGDCKTIIQDGVTGMLVRTPADWTAKLSYLIENPAVCKEMGRRAATFIENGHSHESVFNRLEEGLWKVLHG